MLAHLWAMVWAKRAWDRRGFGICGDETKGWLVSFLRLAPSGRSEPTAGMYITDARHFLDEKGAIAPLRGPAKLMADFHAGLIAYATDFDDTGIPAPTCFKCKKSVVKFAMAQDDAILWLCPQCRAEGRVSNWRGTLWDLSDRPDLGS